MFRLQTPTFNWPKQEFCTLYIFYYKETENIYPYYVSSNPVVLSAFWYISPLFCRSATLHPLSTLASIFRLYGCVHSPASYTHSLAYSLSLTPAHHTKKLVWSERKKRKKEKKLSDSFFVFEQGLSSLLVHMVPPFRCYVGRKKKLS